jgi:YesN/AraC family two-component response regulator
MSNLESEKEKVEELKRPYNLREKKKKNAAYRNLIRPQLADELYKKIIDIVVKQKKYRCADFSAKDLAKELDINTRYLSAVINSRFGENYSCLHNKYRIKESLKLLADKKLASKNIEDISAMVGFANRQSFYASFYKFTGETPNSYRRRKLRTSAK